MTREDERRELLKRIDREIGLANDRFARHETRERGKLTSDAPHAEIGRAVADDQHRTFELELGELLRLAVGGRERRLRVESRVSAECVEANVDRVEIARGRRRGETRGARARDEGRRS